MSAPRIAYWSSQSGNTHRFVQSLGEPAVRIPNDDPPEMSGPFVLITPTFAAADGRGAVPKPVIRFLNNPETRKHLRGVIGGGNMNFGELFAIGGRAAAEKCGVPVLHLFELAGTPRDADIVREKLEGVC